MKVLVDTNVLVSAILKDRAPEEVVLRVVRDAEIEWVVSDEILAEYREVLRRPRFALPTGEIASWLGKTKEATTVIEVVVPVEFPRDPKDAAFVACALAAGADFLITGDRALREEGKFGSTLVVTVSEFKLHLSTLDRFREERKP